LQGGGGAGSLDDHVKTAAGIIGFFHLLGLIGADGEVGPEIRR